MLAGLLFATHDADDRPDRLAATLPFGGVTLIEYQARLLIQAGAAQIVVVVSRLTPELLGALSRIGRRGVTVDAVRGAAEAAEKLHPLARVLMLADGLITTGDVVAGLAGEGGDALLVVEGAAASAGFERIGGQLAWAGIARLDPRRIAEVARMPRDYDLQSALLRVASQAHALHVALPAEALRHGHGIEHHGRTLEERGRLVLASIVSQRSGWFDRLVLAPVSRRVLPVLLTRTVPGEAVGGIAAILGLSGLGALWLGFWGTGTLLALLGSVGLSIGRTLAELRDEPQLARWQEIAGGVLPALAVLALGRATSLSTADGAAQVLAVGLVALGLAAERAIPERRRLWWGSPAAYLAVVVPFVLLGASSAGLGLSAAYATATLLAAIEALRRQA